MKIDYKLINQITKENPGLTPSGLAQDWACKVALDVVDIIGRQECRIGYFWPANRSRSLESRIAIGDDEIQAFERDPDFVRWSQYTRLVKSETT